ncbi:MAG TPA: sigma-54 dependent transcriptional regulator [Candidatus Binatia bacterium]|jgi:two-component system response regulator GlrR
MVNGKILVVDDDHNLLELARMRLESASYDVSTALTEEQAVETVKAEPVDLSIVDLQLDRQDGISLMQELHAINPEMPVIILTAYGTIESAVEAMKKGAYSYLTKPFESRELLFQLEKALENRRLNSEIRRLRGLLEERYGFNNIVAKSEKMRNVLELVSRSAKTDSTIYLSGESGTGKELIAKAVHLSSERRDQIFVAINCAALPEALLESELFGHERGAFTGAVRKAPGLFTQADEGTFFLDEIGDMPLSIQAKLLRVLEEKKFYPVGGEKPVAVNVRLIVATNKDLEGEVKKGNFREDLFYRIHVIPISLPALRDRREDIPPLVEHFLEKFNEKTKKEVKGLAPQAMQRLMLYDWPGNVRELEHVIEYAVAMTQTDVITEDLILLRTKMSAEEPWRPLKQAKGAFEKNYLIRLLELSGGNVSQAARLAGKYRADFYDLIKKHGLNVEDFKKSK